MRKLTPQQKKRYSYQKDCRNMYRENAKSSRKNIPKSKQRGHQQERRVAHHLLATITSDEIQLAETMDKFKDKVTVKSLKRFKKWSDRPLAEVLMLKRQRQLKSLINSV